MTPDDLARNIPLSDCLCFERQCVKLCAQHKRVADAIRAAIAEEREACAQILDKEREEIENMAGNDLRVYALGRCAAEIRRRSNA